MRPIAKNASRFTEADIDDEIVVMRLDNGDFFSIAGTGASIWRLIDGTRTREQLIAALGEDFDVEEPAIAEDVDEFLSRLTEIGLLAV